MMLLRRKGQALSDSSIRLRVSSSKPSNEQVRFPESVTMVTDTEFKIPLIQEKKKINIVSLIPGFTHVFT